MIYITGDTHGLIDFEKLIYFNKGYYSTKDVLIILGDAGIVWSRETLDDYIRKFNFLGITVIYIDGNHENFHLLECFPIVERFGAKMHYLDNNVYHVLRGEIMTINDLKFLCIGGAISIDKKYRKLGLSYWPEEEIMDEDINNAISNLKKVNFKVDYVLTHCCDSKTVSNEFGYTPDICNAKLNFIDKLVDYKYWYFGHYHVDRIIDNKKRCFYDNILEIKKEYRGNKNKKYNSPAYFIEDIRHCKYVSNAPYLYSKFNYNTKIVEEDLPEWYVHGRFHKRWGYISSRGIAKIKYYPNMWINHYLRDDNLKIIYDDGFEIHVDGYDIVEMILAIEKYNNVDLTYLKKKVNFKATFYNYYHKEDLDFEEVSNAFKEVSNDKEIEEKIMELIHKVNEKEKYLPNAAEYVMDSYLSDEIFKKETGFYQKTTDELYSLLEMEIKKMKEEKIWRYSY